MSPETPPGNRNVGWGRRALPESCFKVGENLLPAQSAAGKISEKKRKTFFDMIILNF
jgi:hypothetical protein